MEDSVTVLADLVVFVDFAQADWTQGKGLLIRLIHQVTTVHEALKVWAVGHAEDMADFVTGCLQAPVYQPLLIRTDLIAIMARQFVRLDAHIVRCLESLRMANRCVHLRDLLV